jgi:hypothetical protein
MRSQIVFFQICSSSFSYCRNLPSWHPPSPQPRFSSHDDMYEREYGQVRYGIDWHAGKPGEDGNDERVGAANAAMSKGDMKGACRSYMRAQKLGAAKPATGVKM